MTPPPAMEDLRALLADAGELYEEVGELAHTPAPACSCTHALRSEAFDEAGHLLRRIITLLAPMLEPPADSEGAPSSGPARIGARA